MGLVRRLRNNERGTTKGTKIYFSNTTCQGSTGINYKSLMWFKQDYLCLVLAVNTINKGLVTGIHCRTRTINTMRSWSLCRDLQSFPRWFAVMQVGLRIISSSTEVNKSSCYRTKYIICPYILEQVSTQLERPLWVGKSHSLAYQRC